MEKQTLKITGSSVTRKKKTSFDMSNLTKNAHSFAPKQLHSSSSSAHKSHDKTHLTAVNNLKSKCEQTLRLIMANPMDETIQYEKQLWNDIKEYRHENDHLLLNYLIGFYLSLLETVMIRSSRKDPYLILPSCDSLSQNNKLLLYNILIRIGDLNRYTGNISTAEIYYHNARRMNVMRGHAYNQLAIVTPLSQPYKCVYYSARAAKSCEEPTIIAETNLKMAIQRFNCSLLKKIFKFDATSPVDDHSDDTIVVTDDELPHQGINWFYLSVICVYANHLKPIIKPLINYIIVLCNDLMGLNDDNNRDAEFSLMAFDVLINWIIICDAKKSFADEYTKELKDMKSKLTAVIDAQTDDTDKTIFDSSKAQFHDYILQGFAPLKDIHQTLQFDDEEMQIELMPLITRVNDTIDKHFGKMLKPKKIRNVALGSLLLKDQN